MGVCVCKGRTDDDEVASFEIFVKTPEKQFTLEVEALFSIRAVKDKIQDEQGIVEEHLIFAGQELEDRKTLEDYNIQRSSTLHIVMCRGVSEETPVVPNVHPASFAEFEILNPTLGGEQGERAQPGKTGDRGGRGGGQGGQGEAGEGGAIREERKGEEEGEGWLLGEASDW